MSKYTTQVRWIVEQATIAHKDQKISKRIELACPIIFDFDFPIWVEDYKPILEKKILMHYFNKEIGFETVGLWKLYLEERLNLIMPYYNKLYETTVKEYDYLTDTKGTETYDYTHTSTEDSTFNGEGSTKNQNEQIMGRNTDQANTGTVTTERSETDTENSNRLLSDLPQANQAGIDYGSNSEEAQSNKTVAGTDTQTQNTNTTTTDNETINQSNEGTTTQTNTNKVENITMDKYERTKTGAFGGRSFTDLLMQYRESLINIDNMVINELYDLFMLIY